MTEQQYLNTADLTNIRAAKGILRDICPRSSNVIDADNFGKMRDWLDEWEEGLLISLEAVPKDWQPIETAPKDETEILVCGGTHSVESMGCEFQGASFRDVALAYWDLDEKRWCGGELDYYEPTHWMPVPKPFNSEADL